MTGKKLCVFPNDSLKTYFEKGEIKSRYFNPKNIFDSVHVISLFDDEIEREKVQSVVGDADLVIHNLGKVNLTNYKNFEKQVTALIQKIKPDVIRSFNPLLQGWLATNASTKLKIPLVISLHTNNEQQRQFAKNKAQYLKFLKLKYTSNKIERFVLKNSNAVICVYEYIVPYAKKMGGNNIEIIYNKVDLKKFSPNLEHALKLNRPTVISVGRLIEQKDQSILFRVAKDLDVNLVLIGDGPNFEKFEKLIESLGIKDKVKMFRRIPNEKLGEYYVSCDIYAQPLFNLDGIPIPVLEAMACGLPVVISKHSEGYSEIIDDAVYSVENSVHDFKTSIEKILSETDIRTNLKNKSLELIKKINGDIMEEKESKLYFKLMKN